MVAAILVTALACGLVAGVFFALSTFVMQALARLPPAQGVVAMQSINRSAISPLFMAALFGTALACLGLVIWATWSWSQPTTAWLAAGGASHIVAAILVTMAATYR
jgi:uncharacterized membrane protein